MNKLLILFTNCILAFSCYASNFSVFDESRNRNIPIVINEPSNRSACSFMKPCPVAILSSGYGVGLEKYQYLVKPLQDLGYVVILVQHELPQDPPLATQGNLQVARVENWVRGESTLEFLLAYIKSNFAFYDLQNIVLIGHSNGGDISAWFAGRKSNLHIRLITVDNRRSILPQSRNVAVLSVRGSDFEADKGVIPPAELQKEFGMCIVKIPRSHHDDMTDEGPNWLKEKIAALVVEFLGGNCHK